ncbi:MAG: hypothetical protein M0Q25_07690 [Sulfurospirillaceae bacterium]|nr:hypothetical protein [Sulfurospirillaceae bacterium]
MRVINLIFTLLIALGLSGCTKEYMKVPFSVEVDFSKKGTVYETDFKAPWNIWGSEVEFSLYVSQDKRYSERTEEEEELLRAIRFGTRLGIKLPEGLKDNQYFKLKVTLTPLGWASNEIRVHTIDYSKTNRGEGQFGWMYEDGTWTRKMYQKDEKIEFIIDIPLYDGEGGQGGKYIMIADLQRLRNYHIRVESLEDVELPEGVKIGFGINRERSKY